MNQQDIFTKILLCVILFNNSSSNFSVDGKQPAESVIIMNYLFNIFCCRWSYVRGERLTLMAGTHYTNAHLCTSICLSVKKNGHLARPMVHAISHNTNSRRALPLKIDLFSQSADGNFTVNNARQYIKWSERKEEAKWNEEERGKIGQVRLIERMECHW